MKIGFTNWNAFSMNFYRVVIHYHTVCVTSHTNVCQFNAVMHRPFILPFALHICCKGGVKKNCWQIPLIYLHIKYTRALFFIASVIRYNNIHSLPLNGWTGKMFSLPVEIVLDVCVCVGQCSSAFNGFMVIFYFI